jgi:two-component system, NtrC family, response regulator HydG
MTALDRGRILVVDDSAEMTQLMADKLTDAGFLVELANTGEAAITMARDRVFDVVITDLRMERVDGFDVLDAIHAVEPDLPVFIMTAFGAIDNAVAAIKRGAYHYLTKPFQLEELLVFVERAIADRRLRDEHRQLQKVASERNGFAAMVGRSEPMRTLYELIERIGQSSAPVLIRAESGCGKELVARALHFQSPRRDRPFVAVNCTALPEPLLESELFGHVRGAFTGATAARRGLFLEASGGTLFLDEVGDMAPGLQAKLLRVIEDGEVRAVGSDVARKVEVRILAASHQDLEQRVKEGAFRADLFYRLKVVPVWIPPLRSRSEDIPLLVDHFLGRARERNPSSKVQRFSNDLMAALVRYQWPGNIRELENLIEQLVVVHNSEVADIRALELHAPNVLAEPSPLEDAKRVLLPLRELENQYIEWVIARCGGNKSRAADILGIDKSTLHRRERGRSQ